MFLSVDRERLRLVILDLLRILDHLMLSILLIHALNSIGRLNSSLPLIIIPKKLIFGHMDVSLLISLLIKPSFTVTHKMIFKFWPEYLDLEERQTYKFTN